DIAFDDDACRSTKVQVPELVTGGEGRNQKLLGIPSVRVASKRRVGGAWNYRLVWCRRTRDFMAAGIASVMFGAAPCIAGPAYDHSIMMFTTSHFRCPFGAPAAAHAGERRTTYHSAWQSAIFSSRQGGARCAS